MEDGGLMQVNVWFGKERGERLFGKRLRKHLKSVKEAKCYMKGRKSCFNHSIRQHQDETERDEQP